METNKTLETLGNAKYYTQTISDVIMTDPIATPGNTQCPINLAIISFSHTGRRETSQSHETSLAELLT